MSTPSPPSRRRVLQIGMLGSAILGLGGASLFLRPGAQGPIPADRAVLDPRPYRTLEAFAERVFPGTSAGFPPASSLGIARGVDAHLATMHPADVADLVAALGLLDNGLASLILSGTPTPFTRCTPEVQDRILARWRTSRIGALKQAYKALRSLCATTYCANPATFAAMGYPGPPDFGQASAPARQLPQVWP